MCKTILLLSFLAFVIGCTPEIMLNPEYNEKNFSKSKVKISFVDTLSINYSGSMDNEFGTTDINSKIRAYICNSAVSTLKDSSTFALITNDTTKYTSFTPVNLNWKGADTFSILVPAAKYTNDTESISLLLQSTEIISYPVAQIVMVGLVPVAAIPHKPLKLSGKFVYLDYNQHKPIAWGFARGIYDSGPAVTITNWEIASREYSLSCIKKSPFAKNYKKK